MRKPFYIKHRWTELKSIANTKDPKCSVKKRLNLYSSTCLEIPPHWPSPTAGQDICDEIGYIFLKTTSHTIYTLDNIVFQD